MNPFSSPARAPKGRPVRVAPTPMAEGDPLSLLQGTLPAATDSAAVPDHASATSYRAPLRGLPEDSGPSKVAPPDAHTPRFGDCLLRYDVPSTGYLSEGSEFLNLLAAYVVNGILRTAPTESAAGRVFAWLTRRSDEYAQYHADLKLVRSDFEGAIAPLAGPDNQNLDQETLEKASSVLQAAKRLVLRHVWNFSTGAAELVNAAESSASGGLPKQAMQLGLQNGAVLEDFWGGKVIALANEVEKAVKARAMSA